MGVLGPDPGLMKLSIDVTLPSSWTRFLSTETAGRDFFGCCWAAFKRESYFILFYFSALLLFPVGLKSNNWVSEAADSRTLSPFLVFLFYRKSLVSNIGRKIIHGRAVRARLSSGSRWR